MENMSNPEENDDVSYHQSPRSIDPNDQSATETPVYSTLSTDSFAYHRTYSETSGGFSDHIDETSSFCSEVSHSDWPLITKSKSGISNCLAALEMKKNRNENLAVQEISEPGIVFSLSLSFDLEYSLEIVLNICAELETMKERFSKLLLGEDMSGSGKGVCPAVTISNAITNLYGNQNLITNLYECQKPSRETVI